MASLPGVNSAPLIANRAGAVMQLPKAGFVYGKPRVFIEIVTLAAQTTSDTIPVAVNILKSAVLNGFLVTSDTSLGTSTIALGNAGAGNSALYKAAGTFTMVNTPTWFGLASATGRDLSADTLYNVDAKISDYLDIILTIGVATLPASGRLVIETFFTVE